MKRNYKKIFLLWIAASLFLFASCGHMNPTSSNSSHLIILSTPSWEDNYYEDVMEDILDFQAKYIEKIEENSWEVVLLSSEKVAKKNKNISTKAEVIWKPMVDIWIRDFSIVNPTSPVQFRYTPAWQWWYQNESDFTQNRFNTLAKQAWLKFQKTELLLDGGNLVDNYKDKIVVSERFLTDNNLWKQEAKQILRETLDMNEIAIIPSDDTDGLAHVDGMVMFIEDDTIVVNQYQEPFRSEVLSELQESFTNINIVEIPANFDETIWDERFSSACWIYVNSVVTNDTIYLPVFEAETDQKVIDILKNHTSKKIVSVDASKVCKMWWSVRCLSLQLMWENKQKFLSYFK